MGVLHTSKYTYMFVRHANTFVQYDCTASHCNILQPHCSTLHHAHNTLHTTHYNKWCQQKMRCACTHTHTHTHTHIHTHIHTYSHTLAHTHTHVTGDVIQLLNIILDMHQVANAIQVFPLKIMTRFKCSAF